MDYLVIGIDCAVQAADVGLARVRGRAGKWHLEAIERASTARLPEQLVAEWIHGEGSTVLLALDAPLGWPADMGTALRRHTAGSGLDLDAHQLFRRATDRFIARTFGKTPLDVGADRIARTAHWAVNFLQRLRQRLGVSVPLAWGVPLSDRLSAIEVYPAATLLAHGAQLSGYKAATGVRERSALYELLQTKFTCSDECAWAVTSPHLIDATICALAGVDFIEGYAVPPEDHALAEQEGWIWARPRASRIVTN
jgi:predicted RNase H-like nuclease